MMSKSRPSLHATLRSLTVKWTVIGIALSLVAGAACLLYSSKYSSESQVKLLAQSIGRAFRPGILNGEVRDAQFQIGYVLTDTPDSRARILNSEFQEIYPLPGDPVETCKTPGGFCWKGIQSVTYLHPIYFDDEQRDGVFGYLSLTTPASISVPLLAAFGSFILLLFVIQAFGLTSALAQISKHILSILSRWSNHVSRNPNTKAEISANASFQEFESMEIALSGLHLTIANLERESARRAKEQAQASIVNEIGHDLKTPLSQLSKHFYLLAQELVEAPQFNRARALEIGKSMKRMGDLVRQIRDFRETKTMHSDIADLTHELAEFMASTNSSPEDVPVLEDFDREIKLPVRIQKIQFYRILDNLVRNAREATLDSGTISVSLKRNNDHAVLTVQDTGAGIASSIRDKIFDVDFTTKSGVGTGLGLGIVKRNCDECGARIEISSNEGVGARFTIYFPLIANMVGEIKSALGEAAV